jgi:hypothetical protein
VGAEVETVDFCGVFGKILPELGVDGFDIGCGVEAEGDSALVGHDKDAQADLIKPGDGLGNAGEQVEVLPAGDILAFRHFAVDDAVAVEEDGLQAGTEIAGWQGFGFRMRQGGFWLGLHPAIITIS